MKHGIIKNLSIALIFILQATIVISPSALTWYLHEFMGKDLFAKAPNFHIFIITIAIGFSAFVTYMAFRAFLKSKNEFQYWLVIGLLSFTIIYAPHGFLTNVAENNIWLFILYGPVSRLVMALCFFMAIYKYSEDKKFNPSFSIYKRMRTWSIVFVFLCIIIAYVAYQPYAGERWFRWSIEISALSIFLLTIAFSFIKKIKSDMVTVFNFSLLLFAQSCLAFLFPKAWSHLWWYAHLIFAGGFGLLSYQVALAYSTTGSFKDIFSQRELLLQLKQKNAELSNFAHIVSHDLKTPLNGIEGLVNLMVEDLGREHDHIIKEYVDKIEFSIERMKAMINAILELSSLSRKKVKKQKIDLNVMFQELRDLFEESLVGISGHITYNELPTITGDKVLLFQVFQNLIQNSIKFRKNDVPLEIVITAQKEQSFWRIDVTDNGQGFDSSKKAKAFEMLGRLHGENVSGTGAGLAICSTIMNLHKGRIDTDSTPGEGATFSLFLPVN